MNAPATLSNDTLVDMLRRRAHADADHGFQFLDAGDKPGGRLSYADLERRARAIGAALRSRGVEGRAVFLLYLQGLDFIEAFFGVLFAGAIPVPAYPPDPSRLARTLPRMLAILTDVDAALILTTSALREMAAPLAEMEPALGAVPWLASDAVPTSLAGEWRPPTTTGADVALIQYTSGSTGTPRGVVVTHAGLLAHLAAICERIDLGRGSRVVTWVPFYHDLGLIGGILASAYAGANIWLMSPLDFLARPARWLEAITRYRADFTCAPGFALDLCVRRVSDAELAGIDLGTIRYLTVGAEPIFADSLNAFVARFAPRGLPRGVLAPTYGLAEATLLATTSRPGTGPTVLTVDAAALGRGQVAACAESGADGTHGDRASRRVVGSGQPLRDHEVIAVDPETRQPLAEGAVGELWLRGVSVAVGYWKRPDESEALFRARLANGEGPYLRTGDLGFVHHGEVFVSGRAKDVIIVRGRNVYPQDLERTTGEAHPAIRKGCVVAFPLPGDGPEQIAVVAEVTPARAPEDARAAIVQAIRAAVLDLHDVALHRVVLLSPLALPKTSSGKVQRRACGAALLRGELDVLADSALPVSEASGAEPESPGDEDALTRAVRRLVAAALESPPASLPSDAPLGALGLDSLHAVALAGRLHSELAFELPPGASLAAESIAGLSVRIASARDRQASDGARDGHLPPLTKRPPGADAPLTLTEQALFRLVELDPQSPSHNLFLAVQIDGPLDTDALQGAFQDVIARQENLRTGFARHDGVPVRQVAPAVDWSLAQTDLRPLPAEERDAEVRRRARALHAGYIPVDQPPLLRAELLRTGDTTHVALLTLHHLISDGWSFGVLMQELRAFFAARSTGAAVALPPLDVQHADFAFWERQAIDPATFPARLAEIGRSLVPLDFPLDRPRPETLRKTGARLVVDVPQGLRARLDKALLRERVTLSVALVAAFQLALHEQTGRDPVSFNLAVSDRERLSLQRLVGFFAYGLIHQGEIGRYRSDPRALLREAQRTLLSTDHLDRLRMVLRTTSNRVMLNFHNYDVALSLDRLRVAHRPDLFETIYLWDAHDIILDVRDRGDDLHVECWYRDEVLDASTLQALGERFVGALGRIAAVGDAAH